MAVVTAINFPPDPDTDPGVGGTWEADNGVVYQWDGVAWNVVSTGDDGSGDDIDLSGDVEIGTDCDDTTLTVKSKAEFECSVDIEGNLAVEGEITMGGDKVALEKDLAGGGDLNGDVEIGTDCDNTLKVNSTAEFDCKLTGHGEIVLQGHKEGDNNLSIRPNIGDHSTNITTLNSGALRMRTHAENAENDTGDKKTHIVLSRDEAGAPVTNIYHLPYPSGDKDNEPATVKFVLDNCGSGGGGGEVYLAPCGEEPESPALGALWYQTDELNLKVRWSDTWLPVINRTDKESLELTGGNLTGSLLVEDQETQGADGDDGHTVFHVKTIDSSDQAGGLIVSQSGDVQAVGESRIPQSEHSFTTKKYLDETIEETVAAGNDHASRFLSKQDTGEQVMLGSVKYSRASNHNASAYSAYRSINNEFRLGNVHGTDPSGHEYDDKNFLSDAYRLYLQRNKEFWNVSASEQYEWSDQRIVSRCMDRISFREDVVALVREGSRNRSELAPPSNFSDKKYTIVREVRWSKDAAHAGEGGGEGPMQMLQWLCDPDLSSESEPGYAQLETANNHLAPRATRAATVGWVERKIVEAGVGKGSDLCANSEEGAELGGFWRDVNGRVYVKTN